MEGTTLDMDRPTLDVKRDFHYEDDFAMRTGRMYDTSAALETHEARTAASDSAQVSYDQKLKESKIAEVYGYNGEEDDFDDVRPTLEVDFEQAHDVEKLNRELRRKIG